MNIVETFRVAWNMGGSMRVQAILCAVIVVCAIIQVCAAIVHIFSKEGK